MPAAATDRRPRVIVLAPGWYAGDLMPDTFILTAELRAALRAWNRTWEHVLDPVTEIRWPTRPDGLEWAAEGERLVAELQAQLGPEYRVVRGFDAYDPDSPAYEGVAP
ncbi:hypothetical protein N3K63_02835 [Microbacterium sp. W1N]|uniref:hypothetical protein n=1 Tax=Microbacterium festucae TaxID=2977531 RepID=UPI0021BFA89F|nr:hypothetical protein [Microbacterium festucae]MCT9819215.1 hypothetical protein [Microbacterium festucae]